MGNAKLEIVDEEGGKVAEFDGAEGDSFKIELAGVEKKYMLKIMELREATGGVDLFVFPKNEEKEGAEVK
jgi:hypothetical protein